MRPAAPAERRAKPAVKPATRPATKPVPRPSRRALSWLVVLLGGGLLLSDAPREAFGGRGPLTVVYVGAEDCGPCRSWRHDERPAFLGSGEFTRLRYREVIAPHLRDLLAQENWPAELAAVRARVRAQPGAPQWFVLREERLVAADAGLSAWRRAIWPTIRAEVRRDPVLASAADPS